VEAWRSAIKQEHRAQQGRLTMRQSQGLAKSRPVAILRLIVDEYAS
jgi:hypothetical protein